MYMSVHTGGNTSAVKRVIECAGKDEGSLLKFTLQHSNDLEEIIVRVSTTAFYVTDETFKSLHGLQVSEFLDEFPLVVKRNSLRTAGDLQVQKTQKRNHYSHPFTFREEVEILRSLHPEKDLHSNDEMLDSSLSQWRREAELALHIKEGQLGGLMKEAISVACLSKRCYLWALSIMEAYKNWKTKHQGNNKINRMLFVQLPGIKKEETIFHLLRQFRGGELSKTEFNSRLKEEKTLAESSRSGRKRARTDDTGSLKKRIALLERRNTILQREVLDLKKQLKTPQKAAEDIYTFQSTDEDESSVSDAAEMQLSNIQSDDEERTVLSLCLSSSEDDGEMDMDDSNESFSVLIPKLTYTRQRTPSANLENTMNTSAEADQKGNREENEESHENALLETLEEIDSENNIKDKPAEPCRYTEENKGIPLEEGGILLAKDDDEWFKATLLKIENKRLKVHYFGYGKQHDKWLAEEDVKAYPLAVGEQVKARWEDGFFYKAEVRVIEEKGATVLFEDGIIAKATSFKFC